MNITQTQALMYEVRASWWAKWISNPFLQDMASRYFAWKVRRKFGRYKRVIENAERLKQLQAQFGREKSTPVL